MPTIGSVHILCPDMWSSWALNQHTDILHRETLIAQLTDQISNYNFKCCEIQGRKKKTEHSCISHGWLRHHLHICSQLSHWFSFFFSKNKGRLFHSFRAKACRHSTCRNPAGLCWALNWKMLAASLQFWTVESGGSQTFSWHRTPDRHRLDHRLCSH